ncbi:MAG: WecB/TagA/CpsF family glycosyltransferase [Bacteroidota bacterium]
MTAVVPASAPVAQPLAPKPAPPGVPARYVIGTRVDGTTYEQATQILLDWAKAGESRYLCTTGAHGLVEATENPPFQAVLNGADLNVPDGIAAVWGLRGLGVKIPDRVYGPDLMLHLCQAAAKAGVPIGLYGSSQDRLDALCERLPQKAPGLQIVSAISPPYRALTPEEDATFAQELTDSGARIVFVGLGCPKQETWCAKQTAHIPAVLVAVGAAFDFHAGKLDQAPPRLQKMGLEWAYRLAKEPKRLWKRYAKCVPQFMAGYLRQLARERVLGHANAPPRGNP